MASRSRLSIAKPDIVKTLASQENHVFTRGDLEKILGENREDWRLAQSTTIHAFVEFLTKSTQLQTHKISLPNRPTNRYTWGDVPILEIVQSLRPNSYFTHFTAMQLNGLTEQIPKTIYLNFEQQAAGGGGELTQGGINRAFKGKCRVSSNTTEFQDRTLCVLNGRNTGTLGVVEFEDTQGSILRVTDVERTLIDIAVRPIYSGGVHEVARAYDMAHAEVSVNRLSSYLRQMNYTYPYHQAIGYYLERSGKFNEMQLDLLRQFDMSFDFYLDYGMKETEYVDRWRLFVPKGF